MSRPLARMPPAVEADGEEMLGRGGAGEEVFLRLAKAFVSATPIAEAA